MMITKAEIERFYLAKKYTIEEIADTLNISFWKIYHLMKKHNINRRNRSEAAYNYNRIKPQFAIKADLSIFEEKLKIAGIMLYWGEGTLKGSTIDFANSNPQMVKLFLKFLREICGVSEERLRVYLYAYSYHNLEKLKAYWHNTTEISLFQFTKPYIRKGNPNLSDRKLPYGLIHIRYNDKRLLEIIKIWIREYINNINRAGGGVANRTRLSKMAASCRKA